MPLPQSTEDELFVRSDDQRFEDLDTLYMHCLDTQSESEEHRRLPADAFPIVHNQQLKLKITGDRAYDFNDWSFGQACSIAKVKKATLNRLTPEAAARTLMNKLPFGTRPIQILTHDGLVRSINSNFYSRLFDADLLDVVIDEACDFDCPLQGNNGDSNLFVGEQDMFAFLTDGKSWIEVGGEAFSPGFVVWNSEVGRRSFGIATFWFQRVCSNHIVWDAKEVVSYVRTHPVSIPKALEEIRSILKRLVQTNDARKDAFAATIAKAMSTFLGSNQVDVTKVLAGFGIGMSYIQEAVEMMATQSDSFTLFNAVDCLTQLTGKIVNAGDRTEVDAKIGRLLWLAV
ncbi:MAG: DUF932 domain-containing protein [Pirellulaceae bacterium]|nr:DUF932 domain-containing protein [Pirellulaceae bacterium]